MLTQMNVRIDAGIKERGDQVFAALGYTPSQVVRLVWQFAADHGDAPTILAAAMENPQGSASELLNNQRVADARRGADLFKAFRNRMNIAPPDSLDDIDYDALRDEAFDARFADRGLA